MNTDKGYIRIYRSLEDHWIYKSKPFCKGLAWIDLLILANHTDEKFEYKNEIINGKRGSVYRSLTFLSDRWGWSRDKVRGFLKALKSDGMIEYDTSNHLTHIRICNYDSVQGKALKEVRVP